MLYGRIRDDHADGDRCYVHVNASFNLVSGRHIVVSAWRSVNSLALLPAAKISGFRVASPFVALTSRIGLDIPTI